MGDTVLIETTADEVVSIVTAGPQGPSGDEAATLTTTGDLLYRAALANDRLPIGGEGQVLKVSSGLPAWAAESGAVTSVNGATGAVTVATTAQGALADSAVQPGDLGTAAASDNDDFVGIIDHPDNINLFEVVSAKPLVFEKPALFSEWVSTSKIVAGLTASDNTEAIGNLDATDINFWYLEAGYPIGMFATLSAKTGLTIPESTQVYVGGFPQTFYPRAATRQNLGLGSAATSNVGDFAAASHTHPLTDITDATVASTGLLTGGVLSTGAGATEYSITDGTGVIATAAGAVTSVSWTGKTNITPTNLASALLTWVSIDNAGNVVERTTPISASQARSEISLGVVVHTDLATVQAVNNEQVISYQTGNTVHDLADAIGFVNINGNVFSANGANLSLNKSAGVMFKLGGNYDQDTTNPHNRTIAANTLAQFQYRYSDGTSGPLTDTLIDPDNLDDGAGGLTAVTNNRWSVQRIYIFLSGNIKLQRGVEDFPTKAAAIEGIASEAYVTEPSIAANGLLRGWLVVKKGASDLSDDNVAQFISAPKFGEGSSGGASTPPGDSSAILLPALKASAGTINIGEVVRSTGYSGGQILVELADADAAGGMPAMGVARSSFTEASAGTVIFSGVLEGLDTSSFAVNDSLYVSSTAGVLTNTRPTGAATGVQAIARVLSQDASNGVIQVIGAGRTNDLPNLTADTLWYGNGSAVPTETSITSAGRALLDDADATAQRTTLGLGTAATSAATDFVAEATATTKGDILARSASAITRLGVGANGTVLTADSAEATGVKWAASGGGSGGATNLWVPASAFIPKTTAGCGVDSRETATNDQNFDELLFDTGSDELADALVVMPSNYNNGTVTARFYWTAASGSGGVAWGIQGRALANDDALDTAAGTAQLVTDTLIAADDMHITSATSAVTIGGTPAANTPIQFTIYRDVSDAADTLGVDARLLGVEIIYTAA